jgi:transcriptional regulator with XRE-family HTH domain
MLTPEASRAARGLLNWSLKDLAEHAGVAFTTISQFENGRPPYEATVAKIMAAFEAHGVELVADDERTGAVLVYARRRAI